MQEQQSMFADREEQSYEPQEVNSTSQMGSQERWQAPPIEEGYRGPDPVWEEQSQPEYMSPYASEKQWGAGKILPRPLAARKSLWIIPAIIVFVLALLIGGGIVRHDVASVAAPTFNQQQPMFRHVDGDQSRQDGDGLRQPKSFAVDTAQPVILVVNSTQGDIHISTDNSQKVSIGASSGFAGQDIIVQDGNTITVTATGTSAGLDRDDNTQTDIVVPQGTNIQIKNGEGLVSLEGTSGQVQIDNGAGDIELDNVALSGSSTLQTGVGSITFSGSLDAQGTYTMIVGTGKIDITLPDDAAFSLKAAKGIQVENEFGSQNVGDGTRPTLKLEGGIGAAHIGKN